MKYIVYTYALAVSTLFGALIGYTAGVWMTLTHEEGK